MNEADDGNAEDYANYMKFEEFKQLALNPPVRDEKTIFEVIEYEVEDLEEEVLDHYPKFRVSDCRVGFGMTLSEAESVMRQAIAESEKSGTEIYCFHIKEYPIGQPLISGFGGFGTSWRVYDSKGLLIDRTYCSDLERDWRNEFGRFRGRMEESCRFKAGDIVEVLYGNEVRLAVIDGTVRTVEDIWAQSIGKQKRLPTSAEGVEGLTDEEIVHYDSSDDTVWIIFGPRYFNGDDDWVHVLDIMPLRYPLSKELRVRYEGWYKAMMAERKLLP